jgi:hypothetical protein
MFRANPGNALRAWLTSAALGNKVARYTPRATAAFGTSLRDVCPKPLVRMHCP